METQPLNAPPLNIASIVANPSIPKICANNFAVSNSLTDSQIVLLYGNEACGLIQLSYNSAKSLMKQLEESVKIIEKALGQEILDINQIRAKFVNPESKKA